MTHLNGVLSAAAEVERFCRRQKWRFCFIGGVAVQRWGAPRFTHDVDLTLLTGLGTEARFADRLLDRFSARMPEARQFALDHRVLLVRTRRGVDVDIALGAFPYEEACVERATVWKAGPRISLTTCSAEDLVINKVFASRDRDWADVETILVRRHNRLDLKLVGKELRGLLRIKDDTESLARFGRLVDAVKKRLR
jgi:hypothetical protein